MISIDDAFKKFKSRLELTDKEQADASRRQTEIREFLRGKLDVATDFLSGSYARWTKTKPLKDVDVFLVLGEGEESFRKQKPDAILKKTESVLVPRYDATNVSVRRRSVRVSFNGGTDDDSAERVMSIDVVPGFPAKAHYEIPDRQTGLWVTTDPEIHKDLATRANKSFSDEWKPLVKMIKKWNDTHECPVKPSFLVEVMALKLFLPPFSGGYPYELMGFFATAADRIQEEWPDPAGLGPPVSDQMDAVSVQRARVAFRAAEQAAGRAIRLEKSGNHGEALREWRQLFGSLFPLS